MIEVMLNNEVGFNAPEKTIVETVRCVLLDHMVRRGEVSLAIIDDATMQRLNRIHLQHDYPTDVLSFLLHRDQDMLEGEVIVSAETAVRAARDYNWTEANELLLYALHGTLHLVGYDDHTQADRQAMRDCEAYYLKRACIERPPGFSRPPTREQKGEDLTSQEAPA